MDHEAALSDAKEIADRILAAIDEQGLASDETRRGGRQKGHGMSDIARVGGTAARLQGLGPRILIRRHAARHGRVCEARSN